MIMTSGNLRLVLNSGIFTNEDGETYIGFGFTAYRTDPPREVFLIEDLSVDADEVLGLMRLILENDVSVTHYQDLIDDFCV